MSATPPPRPLTPNEIQERWNAGARTLFELDPELGKWYRRTTRLYTFVMVGVLVSLVIGLSTIGMIVLRGR